MSGRKIVIISGSPKAPGKATSDLLSEKAAEIFAQEDVELREMNVRFLFTKNQTQQAFAEMADADALVLVFPLYIFCLPGILMRFLQQYKAYADTHPATGKNALVYAVVNAGFPEPYINQEAVCVIGCFADAVSMRFRFGVLIGGGGMYEAAVPPVHKKMQTYQQAVRRIREDMANPRVIPPANILIPAPIGRRLYYTMGNASWKLQAKKRGLEKVELYAKPYQ